MPETETPDAEMARLRAENARLREDAERWRVWAANLPGRETVYIGWECSRYSITLQGRMTIPEWVDSIRADPHGGER